MKTRNLRNSQIPLLQISKKILRQIGRIITKNKKDNASAIAGQSALFIFLSAIPFLLFVFSIIQYLPISMSVATQALQNILPDYMAPLANSVIGEIYTKAFNVTVVYVVVAVYLAAQGFHCLTNGLNVVNNVPENRSWFLLRLQSMWYTALFMANVLLVFAVLIYGGRLQFFLADHFKYFPLVFRALYAIRYLLLFIILSLYFALIYIVLPNRKKAKPDLITYKNQLPGAIFCTVCWYVLAAVFSFYLENFSKFSVYGSLASLAMLIIWLYFCLFMMMLGAEINYLYRKPIDDFLCRHHLYGAKFRSKNYRKH